MEPTRFDALAKHVGSGTTRRTILALLAGLGLGALDPEAIEAAKSNTCKPECNECQFCKTGKCRRRNGRKRCKRGTCRKKPNGTLCTLPSGGTCKGGSCACPGGLTDCFETCVNTQTDVSHCGSCGTACAGGQTCCSGSCKNLQVDPTNCGTCGTVCAAPTVLCLAGACCKPPTSLCAAPGADATCCSGACLPANMAIPFPHCA